MGDVIMALAFLVLFVGTCGMLEDHEETIDNLCAEVLAAQPSLPDSLAVAQRYPDCVWWGDSAVPANEGGKP